MLSAFTPVLVSVPVTVATHGVVLTVHRLISRSLSAVATAAGSIRYFRLAGVPISSLQDVALRQMIRPGPTFVAAPGTCAHAVVAPAAATTTVTPNHLALDASMRSPPKIQLPPAARPDSRGSAAQAQEPFSPGR